MHDWPIPDHAQVQVPTGLMACLAHPKHIAWRFHLLQGPGLERCRIGIAEYLVDDTRELDSAGWRLAWYRVVITVISMAGRGIVLSPMQSVNSLLGCDEIQNPGRYIQHKRKRR